MGNLLYLAHRLPYPPNKGDKVRSYHLLKHLSASNQVYLGTFVDDPDDWQHVDTVRALCTQLHVAGLNPRWAKLRSLIGLLHHQALGLRYYRNAGLQVWVNQVLAENQIDAIVIFSSVMAQYIPVNSQKSVPMLVDFVDVDSAKWSQYAANHSWPLSWLYRREGERLLAFEREVAARARRSFLVTENEVALFQRLAPECAQKVDALCNGVDAEYFAPDPQRASPFAVGSTGDGAVSLVFTGAMDYWPNIDAVAWFVSDVLPQLLTRWPGLRFYIVGRNPPPTVQNLASPSVVVTGTVADVRPYLQHATLVVAPLRVARGIQNKILEAMAMARPVIASRECAGAVSAVEGKELLSAGTASEFVDQIQALLNAPERAVAVGHAGRECVVQHYSWTAHLGGIDRYLSSTPVS
ncbi:TIGR03087 family PEP-CTERM/XrtA system glycosyltransferase [Rhodoferax sp. GW822-FHT02A01]|uniref:TIGR03087 family PEP-CTERM/XrtA system glycosyltransferase n=1 Tax=Rhodoferax sp. GW822-FHT02A01 TaxID=3141537 RepID=UPI00315C67D0